MIPIGGKPILEHNLELLARHGVCEIAINLHHCPEAVTSYLGDGSRFGVHITFSHEPVLLGTAGAAKKLETSFQREAFLVFYGDNLIHCDLDRLISFHCQQAGIGTIALLYRDEVTSRGVVAVDDRDRILRFVEKPKADQAPSHWVNAGILVLEPAVLKYIPSDVSSDFGRDILPALLEHGERLYGYRFGEGEDIWSIDTPAAYARVQSIFAGVP